MKPVRLPASATITLPRIGLFALCLLYIVPGLIGRDLWKIEDAAGFGVMWTMAHGTLNDWLWPNIVGLAMPQDGPFSFWIGAICIKLFGGLLGDMLAARVATVAFFLLGTFSIWQTAYLLGRRAEAQPLRLAFGGQPEPSDYGRTLADGALLIYLGCLGLAQHSHSTSASALEISLVACSLYAAARFFEWNTWNNALAFGIVLGLLALTGGWIVPLALWVGMLPLAGARDRKALAQIIFGSLPIAFLPFILWFIPSSHAESFEAWTAWNIGRLGGPSTKGLTYLLKNVIWFAWPAWPFAGWAIYAWRRQRLALHITLPFSAFLALTIFAVFNPRPDQSTLLSFLPPLAILAAFGLPTMKRGAINAVDWFSVMTLTTCAAFIWLGWIAKQTGWPAQLAKNAFRLAPGFKPEFNLIAFIVALAASIGWVLLVRWRISRRPSVLWRAVVLSSGGVILCWLLLMTLWLPWGNYMQSYALVAHRIAATIPDKQQCVEAEVGPAQRASFAYFGDMRFSRSNDTTCNYLLLQDANRNKTDAQSIKHAGTQWQLVWEGHRPSDRDERYRLYRKADASR
jgi:4-amino-4-deoxy-L-arabinose transferase-like glycosyltransferase